METEYGVQVPEWYQNYVKAVGKEDFREILRSSYEATIAMLLALPEERWDYSYSPGKWTVKEVMLHLIDSERIFSYRALRFARNDKTELPGFDENEYTPNSHAHRRAALTIIEEYKAVRNATISLFSNFDDEMMERTGYANGAEFSVKLVGAIIAGHELHHLNVLCERYKVCPAGTIDD